MNSNAAVFTADSRAPSRHWQWIMLFILGLALLYVRNPDTFNNPVMYAEDGTWTALALRHGWWSAWLYSRTDYFVFFNTLVLFLSSVLSEGVSGNPLNWLPQAIGIVSFSFLSLLATLSYATVRNASTTLYGVVAFFAVLLVPLGGSQNEVLGRALQLGFYMPLLAIQLLYWRSKQPKLPMLLLIDALLVLCVATNPVVLALCFGCMGLDFLRDRHLRRTLLRNVSLLIPLMVFMCFLLPRMGGQGGVKAEFVSANLVEVLIARPLLYPLLFPWYSGLSDVLSIVLFILLVALVVVAFIRAKGTDAGMLILLLSFALITYTVATVAMRPGLTSFISGYRSTFPDRYFMGPNLLMLVLFVMSAGQLIRTRGKGCWIGLGLLGGLVILYLACAGRIFEWSASKMPIKRELGFAEQLCESTPISGTGNVMVQIYPLPAWKMEVPAGVVDKQGCPRRVDPSEGFLATVNGAQVQVNHLVKLNKDQYRVSGNDPYMVFNLDQPVNASTISRLAFSLRCEGKALSDPIMAQLFWRTQSTGFSASKNIVFTAQQGQNYLDLTRFKVWSSADEIIQVRFDLARPEECSIVTIDGLVLGTSSVVQANR